LIRKWIAQHLNRRPDVGWISNLCLGTASATFLTVAIRELLKAADGLGFSAALIAAGLILGRLRAEINLANSLKAYSPPEHHIGVSAVLYTAFLLSTATLTGFGVYVRLLDSGVVAAEQAQADQQTWNNRRKQFVASQFEITSAVQATIDEKTNAIAQTTEESAKKELRRKVAQLKLVLRHVQDINVPMEVERNALAATSDRLFGRLNSLRQTAGAFANSEIPAVDPAPPVTVHVSSTMSRFIGAVCQRTAGAEACLGVAVVIECLAFCALATTIPGFSLSRMWWRSRDAVRGFGSREMPTTIHFVVSGQGTLQHIAAFHVSGELLGAECHMIFEQVRSAVGAVNAVFTTAEGKVIEPDQPLLAQLRRAGSHTISVLGADEV
jgi:hypothetical protein